MSGAVYTRGESLQNWLEDVNLWNDIGFSLYAMPSNCYIVAILDGRKKSEIEVSTE